MTKHFIEIIGILQTTKPSQSFHELYKNHLNIQNVIQHQSDSFSEEFKDLVYRMLAYNYLERPSLEQIQNHPWLKGPVPSKNEVK